MITSKELQYVSSWANKVPMPGEEYAAEVMKEMKDCVEIFYEKYKSKEYNLILSNSEEITFEILENNLCHLLGIDFSNLSNEYFSKYRKKVFNTTTNLSSYELLNLILEYSDKVVEKDNDPNCREKVVNYYKSRIKCEIFKKLCDFSKFNYAVADDATETVKQKHLFIPSNEPVCPYFSMTIGKKMNNEYYVASLLAQNDPINFFNKKEVAIPTQILISDEEKLVKLKATSEEKRNLLQMYKNLITQYNLPNKMNIMADYEEMLSDVYDKKI